MRDRNGLVFSLSKTLSVLLTQKHKYLMQREVRMRGETIEYSNQVRYLQITFDSKLLFTQHFPPNLSDYIFDYLDIGLVHKNRLSTAVMSRKNGTIKYGYRFTTEKPIINRCENGMKKV
jgi:signal peptidase I